MTRARRLAGNLTLLNILLAAMLLGTMFYSAYLFFSLGIDVAPASVVEPAPAATGEPGPAAGRSPLDYAVVTEQNLFHPERKMPPDKSEKEMPRPDLVLYGTLITAETSIAYVEDRKAPYSTPGRGKRQMAIKKGESVSGYVLQEVGPNQIILTRGDDRIVVPLDAKDSRRAGDASAKVAPDRPMPAVPPPAPSIMPAPQQPGTALQTPTKPGATMLTQPPAPTEQNPNVVPSRRGRTAPAYQQH
jgi:type II secretory pathway component PulC